MRYIVSPKKKGGVVSKTIYINRDNPDKQVICTEKLSGQSYAINTDHTVNIDAFDTKKVLQLDSDVINSYEEQSRASIVTEEKWSFKKLSSREEMDIKRSINSDGIESAYMWIKKDEKVRIVGGYDIKCDEFDYC